MQRICLRICTLWILVLVGFAIPAAAQYSSGIQGVVSDASGAMVPGANLTAKNLATGVTYTATSNAVGVFQLTRLPPGTYSLEAQKEGFATARVSEVLLHADELKGVNLTLTVGAVRQTVDVTVKAPLLNTEQARLSGNLSERNLQDLPIEGGNPTSVVQLLPGVTGVTPGSSDIFSPAPAAGVNAGGLRTSSNNYAIDGTTVTETPNGGSMNIAPSLDELAELHVATNNYSAERGRSAGFQLEAVTKSGGEKFHGAAFYSGMTAALNANSFFANAASAPPGQKAYKPRFNKNLFGGSIGGPIKQNKAFFFVSYLGNRQVGGPSSTTGSPTFVATVETEQFAQYVQSTYPDSIANTLLQTFKPLRYAEANFVTASQYSDGLFAQASQFPADLPIVGTATFSFPSKAWGDHAFGRIDYNLSDRDRLYGSYMRTEISSEPLGVRPGFMVAWPESGSFFGITHNHIFSPTLLNEMRLGFSRVGAFIFGTHPEIPQIDLYDGAPGFGVYRNMPFGFFQMNYEWKDILTKYQGRHNLKMGFEVRRGHDDYTTTSRPNYAFQNILDFAVDAPFREGRRVDPTTGRAKGINYQRRTWEFAGFIQDDFKVSPKLTLNLGLRYENYTHPTENFGNYANFIFGSGSTLAERITTGTMQLTPALWKNSNFNFGPRFGYAWNPTTRLVVRGGFGVTYDRIPNVNSESMGVNPPVIADAATGFYYDTPVVYALGGTGPDYGYPPNPALATGLDSRNGILGARVNVAAADRNLKMPYDMNWLQGIQFQATPNWIFEADYMASAAHRQNWVNNINRFTGDLIGTGTLDRYNPSFGVINYLNTRANSAFHALSLQAKRRVSGGLSINAVYTWSKAIDLASSADGDAVDLGNVRLERALAAFHHAHKVAAYATWDLPKLSNRNAALHVIAGGWTLSPLLLLQSGAPFNVFCGSGFNASDPSQGCDWNADGTNNDRPNAPSFGTTISSPDNKKFVEGVFPASAFPAPEAGTLGSLGRNVYIGPGFASVDLSLKKEIILHAERWKLQIRADTFNLFNRVNLTQADGNLASGTFGKSTGTYNPREMQLGLKLLF